MLVLVDIMLSSVHNQLSVCLHVPIVSLVARPRKSGHRCSTQSAYSQSMVTLQHSIFLYSYIFR